MKITRTLFFYVTLIFLASACGGDAEEMAQNSFIKIYTFDAISVENKDNRNTSENFKALAKILDMGSCEKLSNIEPKMVLHKIDNDSTYTLFQGGGSKGGLTDPNNPTQIEKRYEQFWGNLVDIPKAFLQNIPDSSKNTVIEKLGQELKTTKSKVLVWYENANKNSYKIDSTEYQVFADVESIRKYIAEELCKDKNQNFIILLNPIEKEAELGEDELKRKDKEIALMIKEEEKKAKEAEAKKKKYDEDLKNPNLSDATKSEIRKQRDEWERLYQAAQKKIKELEKEKKELQDKIKELEDEKKELIDKGTTQGASLAEKDKIIQKQRDENARLIAENNRLKNELAELKRKPKIVSFNAYARKRNGKVATKSRQVETIDYVLEFNRFLERGENLRFELNGSRVYPVSNNGKTDRVYKGIIKLNNFSNGSSLTVKVGDIKQSAQIQLDK